MTLRKATPEEQAADWLRHHVDDETGISYYELSGILSANGDTYTPVSAYRCLNCGMDRLQCFRSERWETSVRCPDCGTQAVVHDG